MEFFFCHEPNRQPFPASVHIVALFIACLSQSLEYNSIVNYMAAISSFHHTNNFDAPDLSKFFLLRRLLQVYSETVLKHRKKRQVILLEDLLKIQRILPYFLFTFSTGNCIGTPVYSKAREFGILGRKDSI